MRNKVLYQPRSLNFSNGNRNSKETFPMNYRFLGNTGLRVSELCLGTMTFGRGRSKRRREPGNDRSVREVDGIFIDTANVYSLGISEEIVGRWLREKNREDWVVATKVRFPMGGARMTRGSAG